MDDAAMTSLFGLLLLLSTSTLGLIDYTDELKCQSALGMQSKTIPDSAISASSSYEEVILGPLNSRIRTERYGGAWCPREMVARGVYEWLQIDLPQLTVLSAVETQGRYGSGQGQEFAPHYTIEYQRQDGDRLWRRYRDLQGQELVKGNVDTRTAEYRRLNPFVVALRVRFVPFSHHSRTICMRVELYGCKWTDGVVSYEMRQGDARAEGLHFYDFMYDGLSVNGHLSDGLGQLTDKRVGHSNFRLDVGSTGRRGFEWIGWRRNASHPDTVEIVFRFDGVRNFSTVRIHANNMFSKDVRTFRMAELHFSVGGRFYDQIHAPMRMSYDRDDLDEEARYVVIPVGGKAAKFVKLVLHFDARWMMISEVEFKSEIAMGNFTEEDPLLDLVNDQSPTSLYDWSNEKDLDESKGNDASELANPPAAAIDNDYSEEDNKHKSHSVWPRSSSAVTSPPFEMLPITENVLPTSYLAALVATTVAVVIVTAGVCIGLAIFYKRRLRRGGYSASLRKSVFMVDRFHMDASFPKGSAPVEGKPAPELREMLDHNRGSRLDEQRMMQAMINEQLMRDLETVEINHAERPPLPPEPEDVVQLDLDSVVSVDGFTTMSRIPRDRLSVIEHLGGVACTEARVCEVRGTEGNVTSPSTGHPERNSPTVTDEPLVVVLKSLRRDASPLDRKTFQLEVERTSTLNHRNVVRFYGIICDKTNNSSSSLEMVLEYSKYGTLYQFLQQRTTVISTSDANAAYPPPFSHGYLIHMATEIASGMKYLETRKIVHRDLATRNCVVSDQMTIKLTDVASACRRYGNHYCRVAEGAAPIPVRWMAWESVLLHNFSTGSDVWSFGVTLWEILTCARTLPYDHLSDQQVIDNCYHHYQSDGQHHSLPQPTGSAKEVYDLMVACWSKEYEQRPTFKEIHMFLLRKNIGFNPFEEPVNRFGIDNLAIADVA